MSTSASRELQPVTSIWWLPFVFGLALLGLGIFFVADPNETLTTFAVIAGIFLLFDGLLAVLGSIFGRGEGRGLLAVVGVLSAIAGLVLIKHPFQTLTVFALIVGVWFVVAAIVRLVAVFAVPEGRGANLLIALVDGVAGIVILAWPDLGLKTFAIILGIVLIVRGALFVFAGWELRKIDKDVRAATA